MLPVILNAVGIEFTTTNVEQLETVAAFLQKSFHVAADAPFLDRSLLRWKYYEPGPSWPGSRSYVLSDGGQFLAHAAIWPLQLQVDGRIRSGLGFSDWGASEDHRGIGLLLVKKLVALTPFTLVIGGAEITRQILPRMGFQPWADLPVYARVLRPFQQLRTRPSYLGWKEPARLCRNISWSAKRMIHSGSWIAERSEPDEEILSVVAGQRGSVHSADFLRFMSRCPTVPVYFLALRKARTHMGYAVISLVGGQARIADVRLASGNSLDWQQAISAITRVIGRDPKMCEVTVVSSTALLESALRTNGYQLRERRPLVVYDSERQLAGEPVPQLGMLEDDSSFLRTAEYPYLT